MATARTIAERYDGSLLLVGHAASLIGIVRGLTNEHSDFEWAEACPKRLVRDGTSWRVSTG